MTQFFTELQVFLSGKKTYFLAFALFAYCLGGYITGHLDAQTTLSLLFSSGTIASLRAAIDKAIPPSTPSV